MSGDLTCGECGKVCKNRAGLSAHLRGHEKKVPRQYKKKHPVLEHKINYCPVCGVHLAALVLLDKKE